MKKQDKPESKEKSLSGKPVLNSKSVTKFDEKMLEAQK